MALRKKHEVLEEPQDYEIERRETPRYNPDPEAGLSAAQVEQHRDDGWRNVSVAPPAQTTKEIIRENVCTYFNLIFLVLAILLCLVGSFRDLTFLPVIIFNTLIGIVQEIRAKNVLEKLNMLNAPHASVVRDGKKSLVDSEELVLDDIVIFKAGNQICADAIVVSGEVRVNESLLTGESDEITKAPGAELMSGSFVVAGECRARLDKVGVDSYISKLTLEAKAMKKGEQSEMIRSLDKLVKFVGIALIPIGITLFVQGFFFNDQSFRNSIVSMVAAVLGMIPEGLYLLASVALAVSSMRLAHKKVLLHDMKSIETLARVNVLCVDKTGTITENSMSVKDMIPTKEYDAEKMPELNGLLSDFVGAMSSDNSTMEALKDYFKKKTEQSASKVVPFTSVTKYSGVMFGEKSYVIGAPEFVLREEYDTYRSDISEYARKGYRVLVFGSYDAALDGGKLTGKVLPMAYVLLANPIRKEAPETFAYFAEQGVEVKVISGDNPLTVSEVAKEAGIVNAEEYVDATTLQTDEDIANAIAKYTVFGRVTPGQKRQFVQALKDQGKTVAMTGDGVNDVLALKDADCSVAMASGSDAASNAAQIVLLDSDFSKMPEVVLEGRRVVNNIQTSASLFLVKNIFSILTTVFTLIAANLYPLYPTQLSLLGAFTIGTPAFFLALQPNKELIRGDFLVNVILKALPAGLADFIMLAAISIHGNVLGMSNEQISTVAIVILLFIGLEALVRICRPFDGIRIALCIAMAAGIVVCVLNFKSIFAIATVNIVMLRMIIMYGVIAAVLFGVMCKSVGSWIDYMERHSKRFRRLLKG